MAIPEWKKRKQHTNKFDTLGRPIKVGDTILVRGYYSMNMDTVAKVARINKYSISVDLPVRRWLGWLGGQWKDCGFQRMYRHGSQMLVLNKNLLNESKKLKEQYMNEYPEEFL